MRVQRDITLVCNTCVEDPHCISCSARYINFCEEGEWVYTQYSNSTWRARSHISYYILSIWVVYKEDKISKYIRRGDKKIYIIYLRRVCVGRARILLSKRHTRMRPREVCVLKIVELDNSTKPLDKRAHSNMRLCWGYERKRLAGVQFKFLCAARISGKSI